MSEGVVIIDSRKFQKDHFFHLLKNISLDLTVSAWSPHRIQSSLSIRLLVVKLSTVSNANGKHEWMTEGLGKYQIFQSRWAF